MDDCKGKDWLPRFHFTWEGKEEFNPAVGTPTCNEQRCFQFTLNVKRVRLRLDVVAFRPSSSSDPFIDDHEAEKSPIFIRSDGDSFTYLHASFQARYLLYARHHTGRTSASKTKDLIAKKD